MLAYEVHEPKFRTLQNSVSLHAKDHHYEIKNRSSIASQLFVAGVATSTIDWGEYNNSRITSYTLIDDGT